ncbi:hypothetical protein ACE1TH_00400 [Shouchella sp. JSM 1781072]|uniref:hypothetical protein n=1 Tax=Shouchella sp. JSM 1781072 TaxID=3344581 RepID=UPI0035C0D7E8
MNKKRYVFFGLFLVFIVATITTVYSVQAYEHRLIKHPFKWEVTEGDQHFFNQVSFEGHAESVETTSFYTFQANGSSIEHSHTRPLLEPSMDSAKKNQMMYEDRSFFRRKPLERRLVLENDQFLAAVGVEEVYQNGIYQYDLLIHSKAKDGDESKRLHLESADEYLSILNGTIHENRLLLFSGDYYSNEEFPGYLTTYEIDLTTNEVVHETKLTAPTTATGRNGDDMLSDSMYNPNTITFHPEKPIALYTYESSDRTAGYSIYHFDTQENQTVEQSPDYQHTLVSTFSDGFHLLDLSKTTGKANLHTIHMDETGVINDEVIKVELPSLRDTVQFSYASDQLTLLHRDDTGYQLDMYHVPEQYQLLSASLLVKEEHGLFRITSMQANE